MELDVELLVGVVVMAVSGCGVFIKLANAVVEVSGTYDMRND